MPLISIVDDDRSVLRALRRLLQSAGYTVETFASAGEFLRSLQQSRPACLILDIHLEGPNGFEVRERLTADGVDLPVIFITAQDDAATLEGVRLSGAAAHLQKPFDKRALLDAITAALPPGSRA